MYSSALRLATGAFNCKSTQKLVLSISHPAWSTDFSQVLKMELVARWLKYRLCLTLEVPGNNHTKQQEFLYIALQGVPRTSHMKIRNLFISQYRRLMEKALNKATKSVLGKCRLVASPEWNQDSVTHRFSDWKQPHCRMATCIKVCWDPNV